VSGYVELHGRGLHTGAATSVRFDARPGPLLFHLGPDEATLDQLSVVDSDRGVRLRARHGSHEVELCEHRLSALAGLSIRGGVVVTLPGAEVPLLDGGALELSRALLTLDLRREPPRLRVAEAGSVDEGTSRYRFEPADTTRLEVTLELPDPRATEHATWDGSVREYVDVIASSRTFGFETEAERLRARGRAAHVDPAAVVVLDDQGRVLPPSAPLREGELGRHKLLDLMGDLFLYGGPPRGVVSAHRPGHGATHRAVPRALARGLLVRD
jgi:UDP-3-O-[3-hydroxymyristoyl] N-acetylglucosamine deacetylase